MLSASHQYRSCKHWFQYHPSKHWQPRQPCKQLLQDHRQCKCLYLHFRLYKLQTPLPSPLREQGSAIRTLVSLWHFGLTYGHLLSLNVTISYMYVLRTNYTPATSTC